MKQALLLINWMPSITIWQNANRRKQKKDITIIQEVLSISERLASAWNAAMKSKPSQKQTQIRRKANAYEQNVMVLEKERNIVEEGK